METLTASYNQIEAVLGPPRSTRRRVEFFAELDGLQVGVWEARRQNAPPDQVRRWAFWSNSLEARSQFEAALAAASVAERC